MLELKLPTFSTSFQQKLLKIVLAVFVIFILSSCSHIRHVAFDTYPVKEGMKEEEVLRLAGEPSSVSRMNDGTVIWTYRPSWKLLPDSRGTTLIEFRDGKVIKVIRMR